jgi:hypothetical protein
MTVQARRIRRRTRAAYVPVTLGEGTHPRYRTTGVPAIVGVACRAWADSVSGRRMQKAWSSPRSMPVSSLVRPGRATVEMRIRSSVHRRSHVQSRRGTARSARGAKELPKPRCGPLGVGKLASPNGNVASGGVCAVTGSRVPHAPRPSLAPDRHGEARRRASLRLLEGWPLGPVRSSPQRGGSGAAIAGRGGVGRDRRFPPPAGSRRRSPGRPRTELLRVIRPPGRWGCRSSG